MPKLALFEIIERDDLIKLRSQLIGASEDYIGILYYDVIEINGVTDTDRALIRKRYTNLELIGLCRWAMTQKIQVTLIPGEQS